MKNLYYLILSLILLTCKSSDNFSGTISSRHSIDPFPDKVEWVHISKSINKTAGKGHSPALLWQIGVYTDNGISLNFPGKNSDSLRLYYSEVDFNEEFLSYFDKKNISVFLTIEPGDSSVMHAISNSLTRYSKYKSVKGICIDVEWIGKDSITSADIDLWNKMVLNYNKEYKLLLMHWNINKMPAHFRKNIVYINSIEGVRSKSDVIKRASLWYKKYFPSQVGYVAGYKKDNSLWSNYRLEDLINSFNSKDIIYNYIFWSETNLDVFKK